MNGGSDSMCRLGQFPTAGDSRYRTRSFRIESPFDPAIVTAVSLLSVVTRKIRRMSPKHGLRQTWKPWTSGLN